MNRTDRLYAIVEELRAASPRYRSARWLAERFEVSPRTVERDIGALQQAGVPVYATPGRRGGYALDKARTLPPLNFTAAEATAIAVALAREKGSPFSRATRSALQKVLAAMPAADAAAARELAGRVQLVTWPGAAAVPSVPAVIEEAIVSARVLRLEYADRHGVVSVREVDPVAFVCSRDQWYLVGWCRLRRAGRAFRLDRIRAVSATEEVAPPRRLDEVAVDIPDALIRTPALG